MSHKIKSVKEFLKDGPPQFDIILRREKGEPVVFHVSSTSEEIKLNYTESVLPEPGSEGLIKIVKRISDDAIFHTNDMIEAKEIGSCFIIGFSEDRIHCTVLDAFSQGDGTTEPPKVRVQVNDIELHLVADEETETGEETEDIWPEPDSAIDEW
jgi:hypothetical protein